MPPHGEQFAEIQPFLGEIPAHLWRKENVSLVTAKAVGREISQCCPCLRKHCTELFSIQQQQPLQPGERRVVCDCLAVPIVGDKAGENHFLPAGSRVLKWDPNWGKEGDLERGR